MRILFMGTPDFAAASLKAMTDAGLDVVGVVSQPDRPKGRGHKLVPTDVKAAALEAGIENIYQPEKLRNGELQPVLDKLKPELIVVVAYGKILPDYIIDYRNTAVLMYTRHFCRSTEVRDLFSGRL